MSAGGIARYCRQKECLRTSDDGGDLYLRRPKQKRFRDAAGRPAAEGGRVGIALPFPYKARNWRLQ